MGKLKIDFSNHALRQIEARNISQEIILSIIQHPDKILIQEPSTTIFTKLIDESENVIFTVYLSTQLKSLS